MDPHGGLSGGIHGLGRLLGRAEPVDFDLEAVAAQPDRGLLPLGLVPRLAEPGPNCRIWLRVVVQLGDQSREALQQALLEVVNRLPWVDPVGGRQCRRTDERQS